MSKLSLLTKKQILMIAGYSLIYPLISMTTLMYENSLPLSNNVFVLLGILLSFPFIPISSVGGVYLSELTNSFLNNGIAYFIGAFIAILIQVWFVVTLWILARRGFNSFKLWLTEIF